MREERWIVERFVDLLIILIRPFEIYHEYRWHKKYGDKR